MPIATRFAARFAAMSGAALAAAAVCAALALPAAAETITIRDAYARASSPVARSGAVFMVIVNAGATADRLVIASAPVAERTELHTHLSDADGVMRMVEVEDGFAIPAGGRHALVRGGDHVMLLGLTETLEQGAAFPLTLGFEGAGEITVTVTVDNARLPEAHGGHDGHGGGHGSGHGAHRGH